MAKSLSGEELKKLPAELEKKEAELDEREDTLRKRNEAIQDEHAENKAKLQLMEKDIQEQCLELDKKEKAVEKKLAKWKEVQGIEDGDKAFSQFYECINKMYTIWYATKGSSAGMYEAIQKIVDARSSMND